jgi:hypothetical protein
LNSPQLQTVPGGDVTFYPSLDMAPNEAGAYTPSTATISFNANLPFSFDQWALVAAHEFGHAVGLHHTTYGDPDTSLMIHDAGGDTGLQTRTLDKCSIVRHYPVDLQIS